MNIGEKISCWMNENYKTPQFIAREMKRLLGVNKYPQKRMKDILDGEVILEDEDDREVKALAEIMGVTEEYLINSAKDSPPQKNDIRKPFKWTFMTESREEALKRAPEVNVIGYVAAGETELEFTDSELPVGGSIEDPLPCPVTDNSAYALIINGDSMLPFLSQGTRVIVCPSEKAKNGDICIIRLKKDNKVYIKKVVFQGEDRILESFNSANYPPMTVHEANIRFCQPVRVVFFN